MRVKEMAYKALALVLGAVVFMTGCSSVTVKRLLLNKQAEADSMAESIITAVEAQDREALRTLFSEQVLTEADDIDQGMDYLFSLYGGEYLSIECRGNAGADHIGKGIEMAIVRGSYHIETTRGTYRLDFTLYLIDEANPAKEGRSEIYRREPEW